MLQKSTGTGPYSGRVGCRSCRRVFQGTRYIEPPSVHSCHLRAPQSLGLYRSTESILRSAKKEDHPRFHSPLRTSPDVTVSVRSVLVREIPAYPIRPASITVCDYKGSNPLYQYGPPSVSSDKRHLTYCGWHAVFCRGDTW